jgi:hypothetical protein
MRGTIYQHHHTHCRIRGREWLRQEVGPIIGGGWRKHKSKQAKTNACTRTLQAPHVPDDRGVHRHIISTTRQCGAKLPQLARGRTVPQLHRHRRVLLASLVATRTTPHMAASGTRTATRANVRGAPRDRRTEQRGRFQHIRELVTGWMARGREGGQGGGGGEGGGGQQEKQGRPFFANANSRARVRASPPPPAPTRAVPLFPAYDSALYLYAYTTSAAPP